MAICLMEKKMENTWTKLRGKKLGCFFPLSSTGLVPRTLMELFMNYVAMRCIELVAWD